MSSSRATARAASSGSRTGTFRRGQAASTERPGRGVLEDKGLSITFNEKGQENRYLRVLDELSSIASETFGPEMKILVKYGKESTPEIASGCDCWTDGQTDHTSYLLLVIFPHNLIVYYSHSP